MADDNQRQYFADVVERLRREGDLGRNGKNSFKTVKDTLKEESMNARRQSQMENNIASSERRELINTFSGIVKNEDGEITVTDYSGQLTEIITKMDGLITGIEGFSKTIIQENEDLIKAMRHYDYTVNIKWVMAHYNAAGKYLGGKDKDLEATGGSSWRKYMHPKYQKRNCEVCFLTALGLLHLYCLCHHLFG